MTKQVSRDEVTEAIETLLDGHKLFPFDLEPEEVNEGLCDDFAQAVCAFLGWPENLAPDCATDINSNYLHHVWLTLTMDDGTKVYFDSEAPEGTFEPDDIPYFYEDR